MASVITSFGDRVAEESSCLISGTLVDESSTAIAADDLSTLTLTLTDKATDTIINSREGVSILNANGGTVTAAGAFSLKLNNDDNVIVGSGDVEHHHALIEWTWTDGDGDTRHGKELFDICVENLTRVS